MTQDPNSRMEDILVTGKTFDPHIKFKLSNFTDGAFEVYTGIVQEWHDVAMLMAADSRAVLDGTFQFDPPLPAKEKVEV